MKGTGSFCVSSLTWRYLPNETYRYRLLIQVPHPIGGSILKMTTLEQHPGRSSAHIPLEKIAPNIWEVPTSYNPGMKVPARIYADDDLIAKMKTDMTIQQCVNVAHLDGIYKYSITMPDGHEGYGFPIGGVAATDYDE